MPIFLGWNYSLAVSGGFFLLYKIFSLPEIAIVQSLNQAFMVQFSLNKGRPDNQLQIFNKTVKNLFKLSLAVYPLIGIIYYFGVETIFGSIWGQYSLFGLIMIPYFIAQFTMSALYVSLNIISKPNIQLAWDIFRSGLVFSLCIITVYFEISIIIFLSFLSAITAVSYLILFLVIRYQLVRINLYKRHPNP